MRSALGTRRSRGLTAALLCCVLLLVAAATGRAANRDDARFFLSSAMVAVGRDGQRVAVLPSEPRAVLYPGTRVLRTMPAGDTAREAAEQLRWLRSGRAVGVGGPYAEMARTALLDMHALTLPNGGVLAGWPPAWHYLWPRDLSFVAAALARAGHPADAMAALQQLQRMQPPSGIFQARYVADGSQAPDARGVESDGAGWALWATREVVSAAAPAARPRLLQSLRPLVDRSAAALLRLTDRPGALPPPSLDYWELPTAGLSLGTAAPVAAGLEAAAWLAAAAGDAAAARRLGGRAGVVRAAIDAGFGPGGYPRLRGGWGRDASVGFLLPPFTSPARLAVLAAWRRAAVSMRRPQGGLAPGEGWPDDGVSWTPETTLFALVAASTGDAADEVLARRWLSFVAAHRTAYGALPEKVLSDGLPAGPAPLAWTCALVVLAVSELSASR